jgi:predicted alpha/beta hydrolase family esterase
MANRRLYIFVNGIETSTDNLDGWHFRAERWVEKYKGTPADTYQYHTYAITRWLTQGKHVRGLKRMIDEMSATDVDIVLVGHSNGCDLICQVLAKYEDVQVTEVHLIAAATDSSFVKNGLNNALRDARVACVYVYSDPHDPALEAARATNWIPFLAYGYLGLTGPQYVDRRLYGLVRQFTMPGLGHSGYFVEPNFSPLMEFIAGDRTMPYCNDDLNMNPCNSVWRVE